MNVKLLPNYAILRKLTLSGSVKNALILLRFPFSVFLLPVSLFSLLFVPAGISADLILVLFIWHLLIFPSSNGYNSYHDRDTGPVGGLATPPAPDSMLLTFCNVMDITAILLSAMINFTFTLFVCGYILASRLYSNRQVRLKKFPLTGFLIVFVFQGAWVFYANLFALSAIHELTNPAIILAAMACSFFIGSLYPITQIYQHDDDKADGVFSLSMLLGKKSTFIFSGVLFLVATACIYFTFQMSGSPAYFLLFNLVMFPSILFFITWAFKSFTNISHINFKNTMIMLVLSSVLINLYFIILLIN